jgi:hypothetical protein
MTIAMFVVDGCFLSESPGTAEVKTVFWIQTLSVVRIGTKVVQVICEQEPHSVSFEELIPRFSVSEGFVYY